MGAGLRVGVSALPNEPLSIARGVTGLTGNA